MDSFKAFLWFLLRGNVLYVKVWIVHIVSRLFDGMYLFFKLNFPIFALKIPYFNTILTIKPCFLRDFFLHNLFIINFLSRFYESQKPSK